MMHDIAVKSGTNEDRGDRGVCVVPNRLDFIKVSLHSKNREESNSMVHIHPEENGEDDKKPKSVPVPYSHQGYRKTMDEPTLMIPIYHYAPKAFVITGDIAQKPPHLTMEHDLGPGKISTNPFVIHPCRFDAEPAGSWTLMGNGQRCKVVVEYQDQQDLINSDKCWYDEKIDLEWWFYISRPANRAIKSVDDQHGALLKHPSIDEAEDQILNVKIQFNWMECSEGKAAEEMSPKDIVANMAERQIAGLGMLLASPSLFSIMRLLPLLA
ncbi:unnamed protein product [Fusarium graminearum]|nr:hypothetical protein HG531_008475 [Fusarium graminearum]CAF3623937.1 unnamed protein product [Fusarium graminearum]